MVEGRNGGTKNSRREKTRRREKKKKLQKKGEDRKIPLHDTDEKTLERGTQKCPKTGIWNSDREDRITKEDKKNEEKK